MSVRSALYVLAFVLAVALLIIVAGCGAIIVLVYRGRRAGFSYFAGGMTTKIKDEDDIAQNCVSIL
jgi:hypothetical protein